MLELWASQVRTSATAARLSGLIRRFGARLSSQGVATLLQVSLEDCEGFVWARTHRGAPPSLATVHLRRTALTGLFATLREVEPSADDPTRDLLLPPRTTRQVRRLDDGEMTRVRVAALGRARSSDRAVLAVALAEATATSGEIPQIRWRDIEVARGVVRLPGASPIRAREGRLSPWGQRAFARIYRAQGPSPDTFVVSRRGGYADSHTAQAAVANLLSKVMTAAGVDGPVVRPSSIRLWGAHQVLLTSGIEAATLALGVASLDTARDALSMEERS